MAFKDYLPPNRVHLIAGLSDAGKTRFILPAMLDWVAQPGGPKWAYVAGDRSILDAHDTILSMGYQIAQVPIIPAFGPHRKSWRTIMAAVESLAVKPDVLVVEGFQDLCDNPNNRKIATEFLSGVDGYLQPNHIFMNGLMVLGVCESPKQKPHERYANPRMLVSGCSAWGYHASTVFVIDPTKNDPEFSTGNRHLWCCTKNRRRVKLDGSFDAQGRLIFPAL